MDSSIVIICSSFVCPHVGYLQVDAITEQIAYPDFITIDNDLDKVYSEVSHLI